MSKQIQAYNPKQMFSPEVMEKYNKIWNKYYSGCYLFNAWKHEIEDEQNITILINGDVRSGKSTVALCIAEALDPAFQDPETMAKRFVFTSKEFLALVNDPSLPPGSVIVWEEVGVGLKSKRWYEDINQLIVDVLQVYGHKSFVLILTTPQKRFLDKDARVLCNQYIETNRLWLNRKAKTNYCLVQQIFNSSKYDKSYFVNHIVDGSKISKWRFGLPKTKGMLDLYETHSRNRKGVIEKLSEQKAAFHEKQEKTAYLTPEYVADEVMKDKDNYLKIWRGKPAIDTDNVTTFFQISERSSLFMRAKRIVNARLKKEHLPMVSKSKSKPKSLAVTPVGSPKTRVGVVRRPTGRAEDKSSEEVIGSLLEEEDVNETG